MGDSRRTIVAFAVLGIFAMSSAGACAAQSVPSADKDTTVAPSPQSAVTPEQEQLLKATEAFVRDLYAGLDPNASKSCLSSPEAAKAVEANRADAITLGVSSTPTVLCEWTAGRRRRPATSSNTSSASSTRDSDHRCRGSVALFFLYKQRCKKAIGTVPCGRSPKCARLVKELSGVETWRQVSV